MATIFAKTFLYRYLGIRTSAPEKMCPPVGVRVWFRVRVSFRVGGQFSSGAIVLELDM